MIFQPPRPSRSMGATDLVINNLTSTTRRPYLRHLPDFKPKYRDTSVEGVEKAFAKHHLMTTKIDGGHAIVHLRPGRHVRIFSYRRPTRTGKTGLIEYTHKIPEVFGMRAPDWVPPQGIFARAEVYARDPRTGLPVPAEIVGGMLNAAVPKSLERQAVHGNLRVALIDLHRWGKEDMSGRPYGEKYRHLRRIRKALPSFEEPEMAVTSSQRLDLMRRIRSGQHPQSSEGVVLWDLKTPDAAPIRAKLVGGTDARVVGTFPGKGKYKDRGIGGFIVEDPGTGARTRVGTGLSDTLRLDAHQHPTKYVGMTAVITSQGKFRSGKMRGPRFSRWHLDKNEPRQLEKASCFPPPNLVKWVALLPWLEKRSGTAWQKAWRMGRLSTPGASRVLTTPGMVRPGRRVDLKTVLKPGHGTSAEVRQAIIRGEGGRGVEMHKELGSDLGPQGARSASALRLARLAKQKALLSERYPNILAKTRHLGGPWIAQELATPAVNAADQKLLMRGLRRRAENIHGLRPMQLPGVPDSILQDRRRGKILSDLRKANVGWVQRGGTRVPISFDPIHQPWSRAVFAKHKRQRVERLRAMGRNFRAIMEAIAPPPRPDFPRFKT